MSETRAVFLDRDGVINRAIVRDGRPYPPGSLAELTIEPDAPAALKRLKREGFLLLVVSNQPDVARGTQTVAAVEEINDALGARLPLDGFYTCFHDAGAACECRKPRPGLLLAAAAEHGVELSASFLVGDRWRDIDAAGALGLRSVLIDRAYRERKPTTRPDAIVESLEEAANWILETTDGRVHSAPAPSPISKETSWL